MRPIRGYPINNQPGFPNDIVLKQRGLLLEYPLILSWVEHWESGMLQIWMFPVFRGL